LRPIDILTGEIAIEVTGVVGVSPALWYFKYIASIFLTLHTNPIGNDIPLIGDTFTFVFEFENSNFLFIMYSVYKCCYLINLEFLILSVRADV
jgi:hypothetical protein